MNAQSVPGQTVRCAQCLKLLYEGHMLYLFERDLELERDLAREGVLAYDREAAKAKIAQHQATCPGRNK